MPDLDPRSGLKGDYQHHTREKKGEKRKGEKKKKAGVEQPARKNEGTTIEGRQKRKQVEEIIKDNTREGEKKKPDRKRRLAGHFFPSHASPEGGFRRAESV